MAADDMTLSEMTPQGRRRRFYAAAGLVVALPLALAVHSWETARDWWQDRDLFEQSVGTGESVTYGGAEWRLVAFTKLATRADGSALVLAEFDAVVTNQAAFEQLPCNMALTDSAGRRWLPASLPSSDIREKRPIAAVKSTCGSAKLDKPKAGTELQIAEGFRLPWIEFERARVTLSLPSQRPHYLVFNPR